MREPPLRAALEAFTLPLEAARLLWRERSLWPVALVPLLLSIVALVAAASAVVANAGALYGFVSAWVPTWSAERAIEWLWVGPLLLLSKLVAGALFAAVASACLVAAWLLASLLAAPFHEWLSRRVERAVTGRVLEAPGSGRLSPLRDALRSALEELKRLIFFVAIQGALLLFGLVVPGGGLLAAPAMTLVTMLFLPLDYASYVLDRRRVLSFREKRRWLRGHMPAMLGYGASALALSMLPGLNLFAMPVLVTGGTLLALRHPPEGPEPAPGAPAGTATSP